MKSTKMTSIKNILPKFKQNKILWFFALLIILTLLTTGCDFYDRLRGPEPYSAEVEITGLESADHYHIFSLSIEDNDSSFTWRANSQEDVENKTLKGTIADLKGEATLNLIIDNEEIADNYEIKGDSEVTVNKDDNKAEFEVGLDYEPTLTGIEIVGPEEIYPAATRDSKEEYQYEVNTLDQYDNIIEDISVDFVSGDVPDGVEFSPELDGRKATIAVDWDASPAEFQLEATAEKDSEITTSKTVQVNYLSAEEKEVYDKAFTELDSKMEELDLEFLEEDFYLPEQIEISYEGEGTEREFEVYWDAEEHEAITISNGEAKISPPEAGEEDITGYLTAFLQPADDVKELQVQDDPRQKQYTATVLANKIEEANIKANLIIEHNFTAAKADDFFELSDALGTEAGDLQASKTDGELISSDKRAEEKGISERTAIPPSDLDSDTSEIIIGLNKEVALQNLTENSSDLLQSAANFLEEEGFEFKSSNKSLVSLLLEIPADLSMSQALEKVQAMEIVDYAEPNHKMHALSATNNNHISHPNDEFYPYQWHYSLIRLPQAWSLTTGSRDVSIAVLDTGVNIDHSDLGNQVDEDAGYNFVEKNDNFTDNNGHGTHVAGTIAANTNNNEGVAGVMWDSRIIPIKVLGDGGSGGFWEVAEGMLYAAGLEGDSDVDVEPLDEPADIINFSLGGTSGSSHLREAVEKVAAEDILIIAAAGNDGEENLLYPARYPEVISVGATDFNYGAEPELAPYSNYSSDLDILAPGGDNSADSNDDGYTDGVLSTGFESSNQKEFNYTFMEGTSMAAPHVAGVAGLLLSQGVPPGEVRDILTRTAMDISSFEYDAGLLNAYWAVNQVKEIEVILYRETAGELREMKSQTVPLKESEINFSVDRAGEYKLRAQIDVQGTGNIDPGDYKAESSRKQVEEGDEIDLGDLILQEVAN